MHFLTIIQMGAPIKNYQSHPINNHLDKDEQGRRKK
jgi:hypothetical protein